MPKDEKRRIFSGSEFQTTGWQPILCVRVKINKRSFEPFLCLDLYSYSFCCACFFRTESISIHSTQSENSLVGTADGVDWTDSDRN